MIEDPDIPFLIPRRTRDRMAEIKGALQGELSALIAALPTAGRPLTAGTPEHAAAMAAIHQIFTTEGGTDGAL